MIPAATTASAPVVHRAVPVAVTPIPIPRASIAEFFGWRRVDGTVIHEGPQYLGHLQKEWWEILLKVVFILALVIAFGVPALVVLIVIGIFSLLFSKPQNAQSRPGFLSTIATQLASFFLFSRLFGPKSTVPVREYRVRDTAGVESLVRVEGYIRNGAMVVGDDVVAEGFNRQGTLVFRRGWNKRLNCAVRVKR